MGFLEHNFLRKNLMQVFPNYCQRSHFDFYYVPNSNITIVETDDQDYFQLKFNGLCLTVYYSAKQLYY
jgi:hypothetical protein